MRTKFVQDDEFIAQFRSKRTQCSYRKVLTYYFLNHIKKEPEDYFSDDRDYQTDIINWITEMESKHIAPSTINTRVAIIKSYFIENQIDLPRRFWKRLGLNASPISTDKLPSKEDLQKLFLHFDCRGRAFFTLALSTGLRQIDLLNLKISQIDFDSSPPRLHYMSSKVRRQFVAFLSPEAILAINEWMKLRPKWMVRNSQNFGQDNKRNPDLLFPFGPTSINRSLWNALNESGFTSRDPTINRYRIHGHIFRKYFRSQLAKVTNHDICEYLLGHVKGLDSAYLHLGEDFLASEWRKADLSIFS